MVSAVRLKWREPPHNVRILFVSRKAVVVGVGSRSIVGTIVVRECARDHRLYGYSLGHDALSGAIVVCRNGGEIQKFNVGVYDIFLLGKLKNSGVT